MKAPRLGGDCSTWRFNVIEALEGRVLLSEGAWDGQPMESLATTSPMVRVAYVIPADRQPQPRGVEALQHAIPILQDWYREQMDRNGFGPKTFICETEADGATPRVHVVEVTQTSEYLREDIWGHVLEAASGAGLPLWSQGQIWLLVPETHIQSSDGTVTGGVALGGSWGSGLDGGVAMIGANGLPVIDPGDLADNTPYAGLTIPEIGPYPLVQDQSFVWFEGRTISSVSSAWLGAMLHELSHGFGLPHDFRNDENYRGDLMGNGLRGIRGAVYPLQYPYNDTWLSYGQALALSTSRYFNSGQASPEYVAPALSVATSGTVMPVNGQLQITFNASDASGLAVAFLSRNGDQIDEMVLSGKRISATFVTPYYEPGQQDKYSVFVYDVHGNRRNVEVEIKPVASDNRAPQPFVQVSATTMYCGWPVTLDASQSVDPGGSAAALKVEWDLDGDGTFDTSPTTTKLLNTTFWEPGTRLIRARVTDSAGAQSLSAPIGVRVMPVAPPMHLGATARNGQVALHWTASPTAISYTIKRSIAQGPAVTIASGVTATSFVDADVTNGTQYVYSVTAVGDQGETNDSIEVSATPSDSALPDPWLNVDVGSPGFSAQPGYGNRAFTVSGGGEDIWGEADQFHFVYQTLHGDGSITARMTSQDNTNAWAKAGVMIRESLDAGSKNAFLAATPAYGLTYQWRDVTGGSTSSGGSTGAGTYWLRLTRRGTTVTADYSSNGVNFVRIGSPRTVAMNTDVLVGLAVTSHDDTRLSAAEFSAVTIKPLASPLFLTGTAGSDTFYLRRDLSGANLQIWQNAPAPGSDTPTQTIPVATISTITVDAGDADDVLVLDYSNGDPFGSSLITYNGGGLDPNGGDLLRIVGTAANDEVTITDSQLIVANRPIAYTGIERMQVDGGDGDDVVMIDSPLPFAPLFNGGGGSNSLVINTGTFEFAADLGADASSLSLTVGASASVTFHAAQHLASLTIGGTVQVSRAGTDASLLCTRHLAMENNGTLDLRDNGLVVQADPLTREAVLAALEGHIRRAYNSAAKWQGPGITSSAAMLNGNAGLAILLNDRGGGSPIYTTFAGQSVDANSILVRYAWNGDTDLNGVIDADDYFRIDQGFLRSLSGYRNGDFNYDGTITADDYGLIDAAFLRQGQAAGDTGRAVPAVAKRLAKSRRPTVEVLVSTAAKRISKMPKQRKDHRP